MKTEFVNLYDAKTRLSSLVEKVAAGDEVVIAKAGRPLVRMVAYEERKRLRFGSLKGRFVVPEDFDRIAEREVEEMFYGEDGPPLSAAE
ncbi:MAG: type II toxin-antitoxin system prevent-host-death family antitoxin [Planctomycetaceae bacterium]|nr:MAG: type II toxin-antitoxin system prevent-host-death family antitoxin [Planctomycetaceae bacterium]